MRKTQPAFCMVFTCLALILAMAASGLAHTGMRPVPSPGLAVSMAFPMAGVALMTVLAVDLLILSRLPGLRRSLT